MRKYFGVEVIGAYMKLHLSAAHLPLVPYLHLAQQVSQGDQRRLALPPHSPKGPVYLVIHQCLKHYTTIKENVLGL